MNGHLNATLEQISKSPGVTGVLYTDSKGLPYGVMGKALPENAAYVANLANFAEKIEPSNDVAPVIHLELQKGQCLIQKQNEHVLAVYKEA